MSWFYKLPFGIACAILVPLIIYLVYFIIKYKKNIYMEKNRKALIATIITIEIGGVYALFLKSVDTYKYLLIPDKLENSILGVILLTLFITLIWNGIIVYREKPEKRKLLLIGIGGFLIALLCLAFYFFIVSRYQ